MFNFTASTAITFNLTAPPPRVHPTIMVCVPRAAREIDATAFSGRQANSSVQLPPPAEAGRAPDSSTAIFN